MIAEQAIKIQQNYIMENDEIEIRNEIEEKATLEGHLYDDRNEMFNIW